MKWIRAFYERCLTFGAWVGAVYVRFSDFPEKLSEMQAVLRATDIASSTNGGSYVAENTRKPVLS